MKKFNRIFAMAALGVALLVPSLASAQTLDLLKGALSGIVDGVISKSNLGVNDICGEWTSQGSAVSFQSENLLKKAGGTAVAGAIESQINPYYEKLGLNNAVLTINPDSTFTLKAKLFSLSGTVSTLGDGAFNFNFKALGKIPLGSVKTFVQKSGKNLDVMFDAKKLKTLVSSLSKVLNIKILDTAASLLDSYDGLCIGFSMKLTREIEVPGASSSTSSKIGSALESILGGGSNSSSSSNSSTTPTTTTTTTTTNSDSTKSNSSSSAAKSALENIFNKIGSKK